MESKQEQSLEFRKKVDKAFDIADIPVKEWIAEYLDEEADDIFRGDMDGTSDTVSVKYKGSTYVFSLTCYPEDDYVFPLKPEEIKESKVLSQAFSTVWNAVNMVYPPIVKTMTRLNHKVANLFPYFDQTRHCFVMRMVPVQERQKSVLVKALKQLDVEYQKVRDFKKKKADDEKKTTKEEQENINNIEQTVVKEKLRIGKELSKFSDTDLEAEKLVCDEYNAVKNRKGLYVYLEIDVVPEADKVNFKHMPVIGNGSKYQDAEDDSLVEKFKKEDGVR